MIPMEMSYGQKAQEELLTIRRFPLRWMFQAIAMLQDGLVVPPSTLAQLLWRIREIMKCFLRNTMPVEMYFGQKNQSDQVLIIGIPLQWMFQVIVMCQDFFKETPSPLAQLF